MTQEEKAKAYDEALERARKLYNSEETSADVEIACETIFPELVESEDELIRKEIIAFLKENLETGSAEETWSFSGLERWISWLEKQGEHKDYYTKQELVDMGFSFTLNGDIVTPDKMMEDMKKYLTWLEKQGKSKWSENDEHHLRMCLECVEECAFQDREDFSKTIDWLKSIKKRMEEQQ